MPDPRSRLYKALSGKFDLGSYEEFNSKMNNADSRKKLYSAVSKDFDLGSYQEFEGKVKKKEVSEPIATEEPVASSTPTSKQATSLATEEPGQVQASDGLSGPPTKMKEFTGFTQEEQQRMQSPQKPATTLPTKKQVQANAGKTRTQMIRNLSDLAVSKKPLEEQYDYYNREFINAYDNKNNDRMTHANTKEFEILNKQKEQEERNKQLANLDQLKYNKTIYDNFLNAHKDSDIDRQGATQETDDEFKKQGVLNTLKDFGKNAWNTIVDVNATGLSFGTTDKGPEFLKFETDPTKEYTDKANKEYEESVILTEKARKLDPSIELPKYDPEQIKKRAYEIAVQSKLDSKRQSRINDFMRDHQEDADLGTLTKYTERDYQTISKEDKNLLEVNKLSNSIYQMSNQNLIGIVNKIKDLDSKKQPIPQDLTDQLKTETENNNYLRNAYLKANEDYTKKHEKLGDFKENLDILNRDYSFSGNALATLAKIGGESVKGVLGGMGYVSQFMPENEEFKKTNEWIRSKAKDTNKRLEEIEGAVEKPIEAKNINSASDFGRWLTNGVILPTAGFMSKVSLGTPGIGILVNESVGNTYEGMLDQMDADPNIQYSQAQLMGVPAAKGAIDAALFAFDASLLKGAQRVIKSATSAEKDLIAQSVLKEITKKQLHGAAVMNGITIAKNAVDKFSGVDPNKNLLDGTGEATAVSIATVGMLDTAPRIAVHVASEFSLDNSALKASAKVNDLTLRLDQKGLSDEHREIISKQLEKAKDDMHKIVKSQVKDISSLSDSQYKETIRLNNTRANIFEKAKSIKMDQSISPEIKKQLFEGLKEELDATNSRRRELLLNGPKAELERMDPVVADALRAKAETQLIKENNPNGDKDVTIPQADIDKRAMVLHNEKAFGDVSKRVSEIKADTENEFGETFKPDGKVYDVEDKDDIVTLASENVKPEELTTDKILDFKEKFKAVIDKVKDAKIGVFRLDNGDYSIDLNTVVDAKHRENTLKFAKENNQVSIYNGKEGEIKTGGTGDTTITDQAEIIEAANKIANGEAHEFKKIEVKPTVKSKLEAFKAKHIEPVNKAKEGIKTSIDNAKKSLTKLLPNVEIVEHETSESFKNAVGKDARGFYDSADGKIHINLEKANGRTVAHEVFHALLFDRLKTDTNIQDITKKMVDLLSKSLDKNPELKAQIEDFAKNYSENIKNEEKMSELFGHLADGYEGFDASTKSLVKRFLDRVAVLLGRKPFTEGDVVDMLNTLAGKIATGEEITERDIKAISEGASSYISEPTEIKRFQDVKEEKVEVGDHDLSFVKKSDLIDFNSLMKEISDKKQKVWFWVADQLGRGNYFDKVIDGEHYLDAGPSFALDPVNRDKNVIWATGKEENEVNKLIGKSDYIFIISGSAQKSKLFNKKVFDLFEKRIGNYDSFKKEVLDSKPTKPMRDVLNAHNSWETLREDASVDNAKTKTIGTGRKKFLIALLDAMEKSKSKLYNIYQKRNAFVDVNDIRDGFYKDNNFNQNDIMLVLKPTKIGGKSEHSTYKNDILGEVVGVPNIKVNAFDIMTPEIKNKYKKTLKITEQQQAVAPYGIGIKQIERFQETGDYADMKDIVKDLMDDGKSISDIKKIIGSELGPEQVSLAERAHNELTEVPVKEKVTSIKNAVTEAERAERGLAPIEKFEKYNKEESFNRAKEKVNSGEISPRSLAKAIIANPKGVPITDEVSNALAYDRVRLSNEYDKALSKLEKDPTDAAAAIEVERIEREMEENDKAASMAGTIPSLALLARKNIIKQDYSLDRMVLKYKAKNNGEISAEKRAEFKAISEKLKEAESKLEEYENKIRSTVEDRVFNKIKNAAAKEGKKTNLKTERENLYAKLREIRFPKGKFQDIEPTELPDNMGSILNQLAKNLIMDGVTTLDGVIDDIHDNVKDIFEGITKREIRDQLSGYGKVSEPNKEEVAATLREVKSQGRLVSALEDVESGKAPLKTGFQRGTPSDEVRRLQAKVQELMKQNGISSESMNPEKAWKTALDGIKTRLKNQIKDLEKQIATGEKTAKKTGVAYDEEAQALKEHRDALKATIESVEGKREISDEQRVKMAVSALEKSIAEYERRVSERDTAPKPKGTKTPETDEIKTLKSIRDNVKAEYEQMKQDMDPKKTPEERALATLKTRLRKREAELQEKLATGNFEKKQRRITQPDEEGMRLKANVNRLKNKVDVEMKKQDLANRPKYKKALDFVATLRRTMLLTGVKVLGKLSAAAASRTIISPIEEITGGVLSKIPGLSKIAKQAPREGGFNAKAEVKAISQWWQKATYEDMREIVKSGKGTLDLLHGKEDIPPSVLDFFGQLHQALKQPAKRNEYFRSFEKRMNHAADNGIDIMDPMVQATISTQAYMDANRAIFMQDNIATKAYKTFIASLERGGNVGETAATGLKIILPIVKVPTNYVGEVTSYAGGYAKALPLIGKALFKGTKSLTPEQSDYVMRNLKKGSLGAAMIALGYFNAASIGGYYQRGEKRDEEDVKAGGLRLFGEDMPRWLVHTPLFEMLQIGATLKRVQDTYEEKGKEEGKLASGLAVAKGLVEEVPFARSPEEALKALTGPEQAKKYAEDLGESFVNPQLVQDFGLKIFKKDEKEEKPKKEKESKGQGSLGLPSSSSSGGSLGGSSKSSGSGSLGI